MEDICSKGYAAFMEETLQGMVQMPVEGICVITKLKGNSVFTNYYNSNMMDKFVYAGVIQQDAMLDTLKANGMLNEKEE